MLQVAQHILFNGCYHNLMCWNVEHTLNRVMLRQGFRCIWYFFPFSIFYFRSISYTTFHIQSGIHYIRPFPITISPRKQHTNWLFKNNSFVFYFSSFHSCLVYHVILSVIFSIYCFSNKIHIETRQEKNKRKELSQNQHHTQQWLPSKFKEISNSLFCSHLHPLYSM